jgi:hypothetical protein
MPYALVVEDRHEDGRIIYEGGFPLAVAIIDDKSEPPDFTLGWAIEPATGPRDLLRSWLYGLLPGYHIDPNRMILEFYIEEHFHTYTLEAPVSIDDIANRVILNLRTTPVRRDLNFLLLNAANNLLEFTFVNGRIVQCSCTLREVRLETFIQFFKAHHANRNVREDVNLSKQIFSKASGLDFLAPIPVIP